MADEKSMEQHYAEMDYEAHNNTYAGFGAMMKWGTIVAAILTIVAVLAVAT